MNEEQLQFKPSIIGTFPKADVYVCGGMGGSALPALAARFLGAKPYLIVHRDYGIPAPLPAGATAIALSYSGNTEETISFAKEACEQGLPLCVITSGGSLLSFAQEHHVPYAQIPDGQQPRNATLLMTRALLAVLQEDTLLQQLAEVRLDDEGIQQTAKEIASQIGDAVPVFYSSTRNSALSYLAKIHCNETGKIPAFSNCIPELNHNEMQGFGGGAESSKEFVAVFMKDSSDSERILRRMDLTQQLYEQSGIRTAELRVPAESRAQALAYTLAIVHLIAETIAERRGVDPDVVPLIEEFKKKL